MYLGQNDVCGIILSLHTHQASWIICLTTVGIESTTFGMLAQYNWAMRSSLLEHVIFETESSFFDINVKPYKCNHDFYYVLVLYIEDPISKYYLLKPIWLRSSNGGALG